MNGYEFKKEIERIRIRRFRNHYKLYCRQRKLMGSTD